MFFTPGTHKDHGLAFNPLKAIVSPRPIGWISSISTKGIANLAPYSFFNAIAERPPMVAFSGSAGKNGDKDSVRNIEETGDFVVNIVAKEQMKAMNASSASLARDESEFAATGLTPARSALVASPRVKEAPCYLECRLWQIINLPDDSPPDDRPIDSNGDAHVDGKGHGNRLVIGEILGIGIDDKLVTDDGKIDVTRYQPLARLGYKDYAVIERVFEIERPD